MKLQLLFSLILFMFIGCQWETGEAINVRILSKVDSGSIRNILHLVSVEMDMVIEGPESGPGGIIEYRAKFADKLDKDFFISVNLGNQQSIVIRTMNTQTVDLKIAEKALKLLCTQLNNNEIKYEILRNNQKRQKQQKGSNAKETAKGVERKI